MSKLCIHRNLQIRWFATKIKLNENVATALENKELHHKHHPGIVKPQSISMPKWLKKSIMHIVQEKQSSIARIRKDMIDFTKILFKRHPPKKNFEIEEKIKSVRKRFAAKHERLTENMDNVELFKNRQAVRSIKDFIALWSPITYNSYNSLLYLVARGPQDYATLCRIFNEIHLKDPKFKPQTLYDFGSGIGSVLWAASLYWSKSLKEHVCIDVSTDMTALSEEIIKNADPPIKNVFYRHFLSSSPIPTYDIVVSAYSLMELPTTKQRFSTLLNLWRKTERYLVIVELGTSAGFRVVNEARDFLLYHVKEKPKSKGKQENIHVFLPCPHDLKCPKYATCTKPCNFTIAHETLRGINSLGLKDAQFSYVVLKKEERPEVEENQVRIVGPVYRYKKTVHCRMCTPAGEILEPTITKNKYGRHIYRCVRVSHWGDWLPISAERCVDNAEETTLKMDENVADTIIEDEKDDDDTEDEEEEHDEIGEQEKEINAQEEEYENDTETQLDSFPSGKTEDTNDPKKQNPIN